MNELAFVWVLSVYLSITISAFGLVVNWNFERLPAPIGDRFTYGSNVRGVFKYGGHFSLPFDHSLI